MLLWGSTWCKLTLNLEISFSCWRSIAQLRLRSTAPMRINVKCALCATLSPSTTFPAGCCWQSQYCVSASLLLSQVLAVSVQCRFDKFSQRTHVRQRGSHHTDKFPQIAYSIKTRFVTCLTTDYSMEREEHYFLSCFVGSGNRKQEQPQCHIQFVRSLNGSCLRWTFKEGHVSVPMYRDLDNLDLFSAGKQQSEWLYFACQYICHPAFSSHRHCCL